MNDLNLVLKFKMAGDPQFHFKGATRIKIDGRGGLMLFDSASDVPEMIDTASLQAFSIHSLAHSQAALAA